MKISLMKKLSIGFLIAILGSIILTSFISNYNVSKKFKEYLVDEHKTKLENAVNMINQLYSNKKDYSDISTDEIQRYAELQQLYIEVRDQSSKTIYTSGDTYLKANQMMDGMMGSMMHNYSGMNVGEYTESKYPLVINNKDSGTIIIGYYGTSYLSSASVTFISTLNHSFILSAITALIFGFLISLIISKQISNPLVDITETANKMQKGQLDVRSSVITNTKEIVELSNSINYLAETLSKQELLRKRLTSDMAHELRTPLTTLKTHVEAFIDGVWEPTPEKLESFYEEIDRLTKMVDDLRNLSKLEQADLNLNKKKVEVSSEIEKIIEGFKPLFNNECYELTSHIAPGIEAVIDVDKFRQIMNNLLSNAYKYLKENGRADVILEKDKQDIVIKVIDNGIGIPEKDLPYIFERFYRTDLSRNKNTGGAGIGLTITKALVEAHEGHIFVESMVDKGTTFTVILPGKLTQ